MSTGRRSSIRASCPMISNSHVEVQRDGAVPVHVSLRQVTRIYNARGFGKALHAVGPLDLELRKGEFFAVVGPSGCGKSTLLELVAGLVAATEGAIEFEGRSIAGTIPDGVGVVFQEDASFPWLTVTDNIA